MTILMDSFGDYFLETANGEIYGPYKTEKDAELARFSNFSSKDLASSQSLLTYTLIKEI